MSRDSPQPECLLDTMVQTRAKRARIQSQKPLSPESTLFPPSPLNKPLEASVPTTSGFTIIVNIILNKIINRHETRGSWNTTSL